MLLDPGKLRVVTLGSEDFLALDAARRGRTRLFYTARDGDTLAKVAKRYGLSPGDLARINRFSYNAEMVPGQRIVVYAPAGQTELQPVKQGRTPPRGAPARPAPAGKSPGTTKPRAEAAPTTVKPTVVQRGSHGKAQVATNSTKTSSTKAGTSPAKAPAATNKAMAKAPIHTANKGQVKIAVATQPQPPKGNLKGSAAPVKSLPRPLPVSFSSKLTLKKS